MGPTDCFLCAHLGVHLRDDQGHALSHAEGRAVVHNLRQAASGGRHGCLPSVQSVHTIAQSPCCNLSPCSMLAHGHSAWAKAPTHTLPSIKQTGGCAPTLQAKASRYWYVLRLSTKYTAAQLTMAPALAATGPSFLLMEPPALNRAMSTSLKLQGGGCRALASAPPWQQDAVTPEDAAPSDSSWTQRGICFETLHGGWFGAVLLGDHAAARAAEAAQGAPHTDLLRPTQSTRDLPLMQFVSGCMAAPIMHLCLESCSGTCDHNFIAHLFSVSSSIV